MAKAVQQKSARQKAEQKGRWAEFWVMLVLILQGYRPLARRWRCSVGELDLVMRRGDALVGVEIKYRAKDQRQDVLEALSRRSGLDRQRRSLEAFAKAHGLTTGLAPRLDVVLISGPLSLHHLKGV